MGLLAVFPAGSRVCLTRSGDDPRGFYAWYGTSETGCPERGDIPAAYMSVSSAFNALFYGSPREAAPSDCRTPSAAVRQLLRGRHLAIPGHRSFVCQEEEPSGRIELVVYALAGERPKLWPEGVPPIVYYAALGTIPPRLDRDIRMFRAFLRTVRVGLAS
jgi:hypothetical protein